MLGRVDGDGLQLVAQLAGDGVELDDALDFVAEEGDAVTEAVLVGRDDLQGIAAHAEGAGLQLQIVALVLAFDQLAQQGIAAVDLAASPG